eukprot:TRINITY_DN4177_c0_g1_i1.p1 TRINITY_DN4177_c0_g1~~TRINITY_DN4177_c0_g1_i1.p1  ORF type:complete len:1310 (+),score=460.92 TRINITY_DN4177_c0_g1_i1:24-3932(+)
MPLGAPGPSGSPGVPTRRECRRGSEGMESAASMDQQHQHEVKVLKERLRDMKEQMWLAAGKFQKAEEEIASLHAAAAAAREEAHFATSCLRGFQEASFQTLVNAETEVRAGVVENAMAGLVQIYSSVREVGNNRTEDILRAFWRQQAELDGRDQRYRDEFKRRAAAEAKLLSLDTTQTATRDMLAKANKSSSDFPSPVHESLLPSFRSSSPRQIPQRAYSAAESSYGSFGGTPFGNSPHALPSYGPLGASPPDGGALAPPARRSQSMSGKQRSPGPSPAQFAVRASSRGKSALSPASALSGAGASAAGASAFDQATAADPPQSVPSPTNTAATPRPSEREMESPTAAPLPHGRREPEPCLLNFLSKVYEKHCPDQLELVTAIAELWAEKEVRLLDEIQVTFNLADDEIENMEVNTVTPRPITLNVIDLGKVKKMRAAGNGGGDDVEPITLPAAEDDEEHPPPPPSPISLRPNEAEGLFRAVYKQYAPEMLETDQFRSTLAAKVEQYTIHGHAVFDEVRAVHNIEEDDFRALVHTALDAKKDGAQLPAASTLSSNEAHRLLDFMLKQTASRSAASEPTSPATPTAAANGRAAATPPPSNPDISPPPLSSQDDGDHRIRTRLTPRGLLPARKKSRRLGKPDEKSAGSPGGDAVQAAVAEIETRGAAPRALPKLHEACDEYKAKGAEYLIELKEQLGITDARYELLFLEATRPPLTRAHAKKLLKALFAKYDPAKLPDPSNPDDYQFDAALLKYARQGEQYLESLRAEYGIAPEQFAEYIRDAIKGRWSHNEAAKLLRLIYAKYDPMKLSEGDNTPIFDAVQQYLQSGENFFREVKVAYRIPEQRFQAWGDHAIAAPFTPAEAVRLLKLMHRQCEPEILAGAENRVIEQGLKEYASRGDAFFRDLAKGYDLPLKDFHAMVKDVTQVLPVFPADVAKFTKTNMLYLITKIYERYEPARVMSAARHVALFVEHEEVLLEQLKRMYRIADDEAHWYVRAAEKYRNVSASPPVTRNLATLILQAVFHAVAPHRERTVGALVAEWASRESKLLDKTQAEYGITDAQMARFRNAALARGLPSTSPQSPVTRRSTSLSPWPMRSRKNSHHNDGAVAVAAAAVVNAPLRATRSTSGGLLETRSGSTTARRRNPAASATHGSPQQRPAASPTPAGAGGRSLSAAQTVRRPPGGSMYPALPGGGARIPSGVPPSGFGSFVTTRGSTGSVPANSPRGEVKKSARRSTSAVMTRGTAPAPQLRRLQSKTHTRTRTPPAPLETRARKGSVKAPPPSYGTYGSRRPVSWARAKAPGVQS